ncbi:MAG: type II toxin-antitoxin system HicB family antitoxin [Candidatus Cloacimonetes bacterium]|nr:type II toxin-antitoxin system HicB family antitoxin [Candidatus Cloacimonadota bacterium]
MKQTVEYYINLPYTYVVIPDDDCFFIKVKELEGCMSQGDTIEEAYNMIKDAMNAWLDVAIEEGDKIPLPESMQEVNYSGKISLRMPKSLHKKLTENAKVEGVSLNSYLVTTLSENNSFNTVKNMLTISRHENLPSFSSQKTISNKTEKWYLEQQSLSSSLFDKDKKSNINLVDINNVKSYN